MTLTKTAKLGPRSILQSFRARSWYISTYISVRLPSGKAGGFREGKLEDAHASHRNGRRIERSLGFGIPIATC